MPTKNSEYHRRKADQHWDMAGLARQDHDLVDAAKHTQKAKMYDQLARTAYKIEQKQLTVTGDDFTSAPITTPSE